MEHIDFTRWRPHELPTIHEVARMWDQVDAASADRIRNGNNTRLEVACRHSIDIPDPFDRDTVRSVMAVNVFWDDPDQEPGAIPWGTCAFQVAYDDVLRNQGRVISTFVNQRALQLDEILTTAHLISTGVFPSFTGIEWFPKERAEPIQQ